MHIQPATPHDASAISALIHSVAHHFTLRPDGQGAEEFLLTIGTDAIQRCIEDPRFRYLAGFVGGQLAGVVAVRDHRHLYHLFVSPAFQRQGLARALWRTARAHAMQHGNPGQFTVNSTPYAAPVYTSFGFRPTGPAVQTKGIAYIPMRLE